MTGRELVQSLDASCALESKSLSSTSSSVWESLGYVSSSGLPSGLALDGKTGRGIVALVRAQALFSCRAHVFLGVPTQHWAATLSSSLRLSWLAVDCILTMFSKVSSIEWYKWKLQSEPWPKIQEGILANYNIFILFFNFFTILTEEYDYW